MPPRDADRVPRPAQPGVEGRSPTDRAGRAEIRRRIQGPSGWAAVDEHGPVADHAPSDQPRRLDDPWGAHDRDAGQGGAPSEMIGVREPREWWQVGVVDLCFRLEKAMRGWEAPWDVPRRKDVGSNSWM